MYHIIIIMLKCQDRKYTGETGFKLLAVVLSHIYGIVDDIYFSLNFSVFSKWSIMSRCIFYNHGVIEKKKRRRKGVERSWDLLDLLFLYNQENLSRELLEIVSRKPPLDANPRPICKSVFASKIHLFQL